MAYIGTDKSSTAANTPIATLGLAGTLFIGEEADLASTHAGSPVVRALAGFTTVQVRGTLWSETATTIDEASGVDYNDVIVHAGGLVAGGTDAIGLSGTGDTVTNAGEISGGDEAIVGFGEAMKIVNSGVISARSWGVYLSGGQHVVINSGTIQGSRGIVVTGNAPTVVNHGTILGTEAGVELLSGGGTIGILDNDGVIAGDAAGPLRTGVRGSFGADQVTNSGTIRGNVRLGDDADLYDGRLGKLVGTAEGQAGEDTLLGGAGGEKFDGGWDDDEIDGGGGNDTVSGDRGADLLEGGAGFDVLSYAAATGGVLVNLQTGEALLDHADGDVFSGFEGLAGGAGNDTLTGDDAANRLAGGAGNDQLIGGEGRDSLYGGAGNDTLSGGNGGDVLFGGAGADRFRFAAIGETALTGLGVDRIRDFDRAQGDRIDLSAIDANGATPGDDAFTFTGLGGLGGFSAPGQARYLQLGSTTYLQLNTNADAAAEAVIQLPGLVSLLASDLIL